MNNRKKVTILLVLSLLLVVIFSAMYTFALYQSEIVGEVDVDVANWNILLNGTDVTETNTFNLNDMVLSSDSNVREGKFAPSSVGYFSISIDPSDTQVSIKYSIKIDTSKIENENIIVNKIELDSGNDVFIKKADDEYVGLIPVSDKKINVIKVYMKWENDEENNDADSIIGTSENPDIEIPVIFEATQYFGEEL